MGIGSAVGRLRDVLIPRIGSSDRVPLATVDSAWWRMDAPTSPMTITGILFFEDRLDLDRLRQVIAERLLELQRFRHRVVGPSDRPAWRLDHRFDIRAHVVHAQLDADDEAVVWARVGQLTSEPLDRSRPPWRVDVLDRADGGSLLVARLHHSIADGIALMVVLLSLTDLEPDDARALGLMPGDNPLAMMFRGHPRGAELAHEFVRTFMPGATKLLLRGTKIGKARRSPSSAAVRAGLDALRLLLMPADPRTPLRGDLGPVKRLAWSRTYALDELADLARTYDATINDVVLTAVAGGLRRYLQDIGLRFETLDIRAVVPINLRSVENMVTLGNRFGLVFLSLPIGIADPLQRLRELQHRMHGIKQTMEPVVTWALLGLVGVTPMWVTRMVFGLFRKKTTAVMTNVPGPTRPLNLAGSRISGLVFWVPTALTSLGISICSYVGRIQVGVATDACVVPEPDALVRAIHDELDSMFAEARAEAVTLGR